MKHIKTFERFNYNSTNEGWLFGEGSILSKIGNWFKNWKDRKMAEGAAKVKEAFEKNPDKLEEAKSKIKSELEKLSEEDKKELTSKLESFNGQEPPANVLAAAEEVSKVEEKLKNLKNGTRIYESYSLILEKAEESLAKNIVLWLGFSMKLIGIISIAVSILLYIFGVLTAVVFVGPLVLLGAIIAGMLLIVGGTIVEYKVNGK